MPAQAKSDPHAIKAIQAVEKKQYSQAKKHIKQSNDELSKKLYRWMLYHHEKAPVEFGDVAAFLRQNTNWPHQFVLRKRSEKEMPSSFTNAEIITWFQDYPPLTSGGVNRYMRAMVDAGRTEEASDYIGKWWATTLMGRHDQRQLYTSYRKLIPMDAHRRRFDKLLYNRQYTNARAVARVLGNGYPQLAEARIALAEQKGGVNHLINKVPRNLQSDPGLIYERLRWRRRNDLNMSAMELLHNPPDVEKLSNPKDWWRERHIIIRRLLEQKKYESAYLLAAKHQQKSGFSFAQAQWLAGWISLKFLNNPAQAFQHFQILDAGVKTPVSKARANYWGGLSAKALGAKRIAKKTFADAVKYQTTFYGQMASAETGREKALFYAAPPSISDKDRDEFAKHEFIQIVYLCHAAQLDECTSLFLQRFVRDVKTPKAYRYGAELASKLGHYHDTVAISKSASRQGMFLSKQAYPLVIDQIKDKDSDVEWALIHALIRQESMFDTKAKSPAGARGLMQLMPTTAKSVAKKKGLHYSTAWLTTKPDYNITLGSSYLAQMLKRFDSNYPLAIAAYNAGPTRVSKWLKIYGDPRLGEISNEDWIELMPIYETRNYVQRVMEAVYVYRLLIGHRQPKLSKAASIHVDMRP